MIGIRSDLTTPRSPSALLTLTMRFLKKNEKFGEIIKNLSFDRGQVKQPG